MFLGNMGLDKSAFFALAPEFRVFSPQILKKSQLSAVPVRPKRVCIRSYFGETFPVSSSRWRTIELHSDNNHSSNGIPHPAVSKGDSSDRMPPLHFNRLQLREDECKGLIKRPFGQFVAREAVLDEEYWAASWLRAEAHWEAMGYVRHVECYKKKFAEDEFYSLKRRSLGQCGSSLKSFCFLTVRKEEKHIKRTVIKSVVATMDLSIRQYLKGETYPGEIQRSYRVFASQDPSEENKYGYIANVVVAKFARGRGIATNMVSFASEVAALAGMTKLFVHVDPKNKIAQKLYRKVGFELANPPQPPASSKNDGRILLSMEL